MSGQHLHIFPLIENERVYDSNLTPPDGMIRVGSAFPSEIVPLESLWEGAKILVAEPSAYVGD